MRVTRGQAVSITYHLRSKQTGAMIDPVTVTLTIRPPTGSDVTKTYADDEITRVSRGIYQYLYTPPADGHYFVRWETTTPESAEETFIEVRSFF